MDALGMLNALIGLVLVYFVLSLIVSAVVEWITQLCGDRGKVLELATARLLGLDGVPARGSGATACVGTLERAFHSFFAHPQIQALQQSRERKPSYVPTGTYAGVLAEAALGMSLSAIRAAPALVRAKIEGLAEPLRSSLLALLDKADGDPERLIGEIELWVENTWDRAGGWLRRRVIPRVFLVGLLVATAVNADTVRMFQVLTRDTRLQEALVQTAERLAAAGGGGTLDDVLCAATARQQGVSGALAGRAPDAGSRSPGTSRTPAAVALPGERSVTPSDQAKDSCPEMDAARHYALDVAPLLGWQGDWEPAEFPPSWYVGKVVGLLITASALLMGAPFWFDMLKKLVSVRQSLRPEPSTKKRAAEAGPDDGKQPGIVPGPTGSGGSLPAAPSPAFMPAASSCRIENLLWMSRWSGLVYDEGAVAEAQGPEWGYRVSGKLDAIGNDTQYLIAEAADTLILAFRGTEPSRLGDWLSDLDADWADCPWSRGARVHEGFLNALECEWVSVLEGIRSAAADKALWITGHSLGGALALLAAHRLACSESDIRVQGVVTFGQPRCGDARLIEDVQRRYTGRYWRVVNNRDIVPRVPPYLMGFRHNGTVAYLDDLGRMTIDPPLWYRVLDNLDLPRDKQALLRAVAERGADHGITHYSSVLANAMERTA